jgi:hypothetical protein
MDAMERGERAPLLPEVTVVDRLALSHLLPPPAATISEFFTVRMDDHSGIGIHP